MAVVVEVEKKMKVGREEVSVFTLTKKNSRHNKLIHGTLILIFCCCLLNPHIPSWCVLGTFAIAQ